MMVHRHLTGALRRVMFIVCATALMLTFSTPAAAQQDRGSSTEKGSLFIVPAVELRWDSMGNLIQDTFIKLTNDFPTDVTVQMYFVNGDEPLDADGPERAHPGWNYVDNAIVLTGDQPIWWSALTGSPAGLSPFIVLDPGVPQGRPDPEIPGERMLRGYIIGWAVNESGQEIRWNHLAAEAVIIDYDNASSSAYTATHFQVVDESVLNGNDSDATPGQINLDGAEYAPAADFLEMNFPADGGTLYNGFQLTTVFNDLTLHPVSVDLRQENNGPVVTNAQLDVWNQNEVKFSGMTRCITCWDQQLLANYAGPNHFLAANLGTDVGRVRIDGQASMSCFLDLGPDPQIDSVDAALLGVLRRDISLPATIDSAAFVLHGRGHQSAQVRYDLVGDPPEDPSPREQRTPLAPSVVLDDVETVHAPQPAQGGAGLPRVSADRPGSLFIISEVELRYDVAQNLVQDTFVHLSNTFAQDVHVQLYFINGDEPVTCCGPPPIILEPGWNNVGAVVELAANQPVYWSMGTGAPLGVPPFSVLDPAGGKQPPGRPDPEGSLDNVLRGYIIGFAINEEGQEIEWNHLIADAITIDYVQQTARGCNAWQFEASALGGNGAPTGDPGVLNLNGVEYSQGFDLLLNNFQSTGSFGYTEDGATFVQSENDLTLHPISVDVRQDNAGPVTTDVVFTVWNENEIMFSGTEYCVSCWDQRLLSSVPSPNNFLVSSLLTDNGKYRADGVDDDICEGNFQATSLLGVSTEFLDLTTASLLGAPGPAANQRNLIGLGTQNAVISHDGPVLADLELGEPSDFEAAGIGVSIAIGQFDSEDVPPPLPLDSVVAIPDPDPLNPGQIQVFLNQGNDGSGNWLGYSPQLPITVGLDPSDVGVGRFNADLYDDIAVANAGDNTVSIYLNSADGLANFTLADTITGLSEPRSIAVGDLNGDMLDDIAVANASSDTVHIYFNTGGLTLLGSSFSLVEVKAVPDRPVTIEPEDLDNDKDLDLVVASFQASTVTVLENTLFSPTLNGVDLFNALPPISVGAGPIDLAIADLDNNSFKDIISADFFAGQLSVVLNTGPLNLQPPFTIPVGNQPLAVEAVDVDGDGDVDLLTAANDPVEGPSVQALANLLIDTGGLTFTAPKPFSVGDDTSPNAMATADVDQDGRPDVVTSNTAPVPSGGNVTALVNQFAPPCPADCSPPGGGNGMVNFDDVIAIINAFTTQDLACDIAPDNGDGTFGNGVINVDDLMVVLRDFGPCES